MFSDSGIIQLSSYCVFLTALTPLTWITPTFIVLFLMSHLSDGLMAMKLGGQGKRTLNLPSTVLPQFHNSKFSLYSTALFTDETYGYTMYSMTYKYSNIIFTNL